MARGLYRLKEAPVEPSELMELVRDVGRLVQEHESALHEAERLSREPHDDSLLEPTDDHREKHRKLLEVREALDRLTFERERLEADLKVAIGSAAGLQGLANWKTVTREDVDRDRLREEQPDVYTRYLREIRTRRFDLL
jgi:predicted phage-related endonuclease